MHDLRESGGSISYDANTACGQWRTVTQAPAGAITYDTRTPEQRLIAEITELRDVVEYLARRVERLERGR